MKILIVANGLPPHGRFGTEFYAGELARELARRGHEVVACVPERARSASETARTDGVRIEFLPTSRPARNLRASYRDEVVEARFKELLERERPDAVHFLQLLWGLSLELVTLAASHGARTVVTLTDYGLLCHRGQMFDAHEARCGGPHPATVCATCLRRRSASSAGLLARRVHAGLADGLAMLGGAFGVATTHDLEQREHAVQRALHATDAVIAPTANFAAIFKARTPRPPIVLPYAFDEAPYRAFARESDPGRMRFAFLGQLAPHKGPHVLLAAFPSVRAQLAGVGVAAELALVGAAPAGRSRRYAAELARTLPIGASIEPPFDVGGAPQRLSKIDAVVVPSLWDENAPLVCLEARAAGVPIVASDVPGIAEVVEHKRHGLLVPPGDVQALARACVMVRELTTVPRGVPVALAAHVDRVEELLRG